MMRYLCLAALLLLPACAHEAENTGSQNSSVTTSTMTYAMAAPVATPVAYQPVIQDSVLRTGGISRYQRTKYVPGGPDGDMDPCAKNFDAIMDHLEGLMADKIRENNEIAEKQAAMPRYTF